MNYSGRSTSLPTPSSIFSAWLVIGMRWCAQSGRRNGMGTIVFLAVMTQKPKPQKQAELALSFLIQSVIWDQNDEVANDGGANSSTIKRGIELFALFA